MIMFFCSFKEKASEAMEVFDELMESEVSIIVPHIAEIVQFCLEVCPHIFIVIMLILSHCVIKFIFLSSRSVQMSPLVILCV